MVRIACIGIGSHTGFVMDSSAEELRREGYDFVVTEKDVVDGCKVTRIQ